MSELVTNEELAAAWADDLGRARDAAIPTREDIMSLVRQYGLARIAQNTSVPTRRQRENATLVAWHEDYCREVARLEAAIATALAAAGLK